MSKSIQENFLRYEFKYLLNDDLKKSVEKELKHFMQLDPFVEKFDNKKYLVRSLYFLLRKNRWTNAPSKIQNQNVLIKL